jgi:hypothetical protein
MPALSGIGIFVLMVAVVAFVIWMLQNRKAGKIRTVPFRKPSEIAQQGPAAADAKQMVSTEGQMGGQPLVGPMSGKPCAYFEVEVKRHFHKRKTDLQGNITKEHSTKTVFEQKQGTVFQLTDGQGAVGVDCTKPPSGDLETGHSSRVNIGLVVPNEVSFGNLRMQTGSLLVANVVGALLDAEVTDHFEGMEKIVPLNPGQNAFALGKLQQTSTGLVIGPTGWSALLLSTKGREATLGSAVKFAKIALIAGVVLLVGGGVCTALGFVLAPADSGKPAASAEATSKPTGTSAAATAAATSKPATPTATSKTPAKK